MGIAARTTFMAGCMVRTPMRVQIEAAAKAGFDSLSTWPNLWRHAVAKDGLSARDLRALLADHGMALTDVDGCTDWVPEGDGSQAPVGPNQRITERHEFFEWGQALGASTVVAVHLDRAPLEMARDTDGLAHLADQAAEHGLRVALEAVSFSNIADVPTAWKMVRDADRANLGLVFDVAHHVRSGAAEAALREVPADRIFTVQLCDGPAAAPADLAAEAMYHRQLPGEGEMDVARWMAVLDDMGVRASVGPEVYVEPIAEGQLDAVMRHLFEVTRRFAAP